MFTTKDLEQFDNKGISRQKVNEQISYFREGFPPLPVVSTAVVGDGIESYSSGHVEKMLSKFPALTKGLKIVKFVPASGAATRMFKELYEFVNEDRESPAVTEALANIEKFGFYDKLKSTGKADGTPKEIISAIVGQEGLGYGKSPKALILFHKYKDGSRTALEEHMAEGAMYAESSDGTVNIHFTVSPEHQAAFENLVNEILPQYEDKYGVKYNISYSQQKPQTDTVAVDMDNNPFREEDGSILFRPAGHGALLENLNDIDADLIYIKTVDNVVPDSRKADTVTYKKVLAVVLLDTQMRCFEYLNALASGANERLVEEIAEFVSEDLAYRLEPGFNSRGVGEKSKILKAILNRPIRVCGMVRNEGEPGGGPFWVKNHDRSQSLQIAESSQIAPAQKELMKKSTHFNPVDIVCGVKDYNDNKFDLRRFVDPRTGFISEKSKNGKALKAQELPGLWNGAMANWNTIFVEVPITTFAPVKVVNDLLRPQHQQ